MPHALTSSLAAVVVVAVLADHSSVSVPDARTQATRAQTRTIYASATDKNGTAITDMLGSDFDGGPTLPLGMRDIRDLPLLTDAMLKRNWSEPRIRKFLGGNLLRVVRQVTEPQKNTGK